jgi:photosystem II stability/assembly factor-like uncharacterized protein
VALFESADAGVLPGAVGLLVALILAGCGGNAESAPSGGLVDESADPPYIGALDVDPRDGSLLMGTNKGLFRVGARGGEPKPVEARMGRDDVSAGLSFSFVGPGELIGSGHPGPQARFPVLGLVRSDDGGRTWEPVSRTGLSDFHSVERSGDSIVASEGGSAVALVSRDGGRTFETRATPLAVVDLAVDPARPERWVASAETGIFTTDDGGEGWRPRDTVPNARFAWPESEVLYRVDPDGPVRLSEDGGETWEEVGRVEGETHALTAADAKTLYAADAEGAIRVSRDGGRSWSKL